MQHKYPPPPPRTATTHLQDRQSHSHRSVCILVSGVSSALVCTAAMGLHRKEYEVAIRSLKGLLLRRTDPNGLKVCGGQARAFSVSPLEPLPLHLPCSVAHSSAQV